MQVISVIKTSNWLQFHYLQMNFPDTISSIHSDYVLGHRVDDAQFF